MLVSPGAVSRTDSLVPRLISKRRYRPRILCVSVLSFLLLSSWSLAQGSAAQPPEGKALPATVANTSLPDAPSASAVSPTNSFADGLATVAKTIGEDELNILKAPFKKKNFKWDILVVGATGVLIANDESVIHQVPTGWHSSSIDLSNAALGATAATAGGIYLTGLFTDNEHAKQTGVLSAESAIDSTILFGAMKVVFARQRPFTGEGEGKFFSGNWSNGSFPSGHATLSWAIASTVAHQYHSVWLDILLYGLATTVSTSRVTAREHFPADVFAGSVLGYGVGAYVTHKDTKKNVRPKKVSHTFPGPP